MVPNAIPYAGCSVEFVQGDGHFQYTVSAANIAACNYDKAAADKDHPAAVDMQAGMTGPDGTQITVNYPSSGFTCMM